MVPAAGGILIPDWDQPIDYKNFEDSHLLELLWFLHDLQLWNGKEILPLPPDVEMASDAAKTIGGGLVLFPFVGADQKDALDSKEARWLWHWRELSWSINPKELASFELGLRAMDRMAEGLLYDIRILMNTDSSVAMSYVNKMGGGVSYLSRIAESLWLWLIRRGCTIFCRHIAGVLNTRADRASRHRGDRSEWQLCHHAFRDIEQQFGPHSVDLMASRTNTLLSRYYSRYGDPSAVGEDCLKADWRLEGNMYCHPPFAMIPQILQKLVREKVELTLVAPVWPGHFWITLLMEYSMTLPFVLDHENLIMPAVPYPWAVTQPVWRTAVWRLCGEPSKRVVLHQEQWREFFASGGGKR
jgi:hypothetical protein